MKNDIEIILDLLREELTEMFFPEEDFDYGYQLGIKHAIEIVEKYKHKLDVIKGDYHEIQEE